MHERRLIALMALGVMAMSPGARADLLMPVSSSMSLEADANILYGSPATSTDSQSQRATTSPLNASVSASSGTSSDGNPWLTVTGSGSADWITPSQGEVRFADLGWAGYEANGIANLTQSAGWTYTFVASTTGPLVIDYSVTVSGSSSTTPLPFFGLNGFYVYCGTGRTLPADPLVKTGINSSGSIDLAVTNGAMYTIEIQPFSNLGGGIGTTDVHMDGTFDFSAGSEVVAVPELSTATMPVVISGLATIVSVLKRLRRPATPRRHSRARIRAG